MDPGFQAREGALKKIDRAEGGANIFGVFRVKNHDFTPTNHIFPILGGARRMRPPGSAPAMCDNDNVVTDEVKLINK